MDVNQIKKNFIYEENDDGQDSYNEYLQDKSSGNLGFLPFEQTDKLQQVDSKLDNKSHMDIGNVAEKVEWVSAVSRRLQSHPEGDNNFDSLLERKNVQPEDLVRDLESYSNNHKIPTKLREAPLQIEITSKQLKMTVNEIDNIQKYKAIPSLESNNHKSKIVDSSEFKDHSFDSISPICNNIDTNKIDTDGTNPNHGGSLARNEVIVEENCDIEISALFQNARDVLKKLDTNVNQQKKQIVVELAKNLEKRIQLDTICMEIVTQLRGQVSERFVRQCLDEKYKQKSRIENARRQKKQNYLENEKDIDKLAAVTPLNQEYENDKIILVEANGQAIVQKDGDNNDKLFSDMDDYDSTKDNTQLLSSKLSHQKEQKQRLGMKNDRLRLKECPSCKELQLQNLELEEALRKLNQFTFADKMKSNNNNNKNAMISNNILDFEFCKPYVELSKYVSSFLPFGPTVDVWFSGKIDTSTRKVISSGYGRVRRHQGQEQLTNETNDDDWEEVVR